MDRVSILNGKALAAWATLVLLFVLTPLVLVVFTSLSEAQFISFPWNEGWSLKWYAEIPHQQQFIDGLGHSLFVAVVAAIVAVILGTLAAIAITRERFRGRGIVVLLGSSSLFVPEVLFALALLIMISQVKLTEPFVNLMLGHIVLILPFVMRVVSAAMTDFNLDQENAATNLGATRFEAFMRITFPQIRSGVVAAGVMAFIVSFDNVSISLFIAGPGYEMLPVALYAYALNSFDGIAAAVSVSMIVISLIVIVVLDRIVGLDKLFGGNAS